MLEWNESTLDTKNDVSNTLFEIYKYFFDTKEVEFSMLLFSDYCKCLKKTYQWFYSLKWSESTDNLSNQFFSCLNIFEELVKISLYPEYIDRNHEIFSTLAEKTVHAITTYINAKPSFENMISTNFGEEVWFDFNNDTPESVYQRINDYLEDNWEDGVVFMIEDE